MLPKIFRKCFYSAYLCCFISGLALLLTPVADPDSSGFIKVFSICLAILFWIGVISEIFLFNLANKKRLKIEEEIKKRNGRVLTGMSIGLISFFKYPEGTVFDVAVFVTAVAFVLTIVFNANDWLFSCSLALLYISINSHCFFNGKNFGYVKQFNKYIKKQGAKENE